MKLNLATWDRIVRIVVGIALLSIVFVGPASVLGLFGLIPLATGIFGVCPLYSAFGISTCPADRRADRPAARPTPKHAS